MPANFWNWTISRYATYEGHVKHERLEKRVKNFRCYFVGTDVFVEKINVILFHEI